MAASEHLPVQPVLIVDDDPALREFVAMALSELGYRTVVACDGVEALRVVDNEVPALALVDKSIPPPGGADLARALHARLGCPVPCVLMSGSAAEQEEVAAAEIAAYLQKPFELNDLLNIVERLMPPATGGASERSALQPESG